ncbi:MAG: hypothetical protein CL927_20075 [Deltaproteobacteria bacterium]|nr:hypothetical protein [Deltaproteobacteria bacterium]HCH66837.1 hypothetical protein [Deltaproteobacteria bacterium]
MPRQHRTRSNKHRPRRHRQGRVQLLTVFLLLVAAVIGFFAYIFVPYHLDYLNMKEVVKSSALAWYAHVEEHASREKFRIAMNEKGIEYITAEDCTWEKRSELYMVSCYWAVDVYYPGTDYFKTLEYEVGAEANQRGGVEIY